MTRDLVVTPRWWTPRGEVELEVHGKPMRVWGGIRGEHGRVRVVHEGRNQAYAVFKEGMPPDPRRVDPTCRRYDTCGGCPWMHINAEGQRDARREVVMQALEEERFDVPVGPVVASPDGQRGFRWVTKLGIGRSDIGRLRVGAWGRRTRSVVPIPECDVVPDILRKVMKKVAHHVIEYDIWPYDAEADTGLLRAIIIRGSRTTGDVLVTLVAGSRKRILSDLAATLMADAGGITGISLHVNDDPGNNIFTRDEEGAVRTRLLEGRPWIEEELNGIRYRIGAGDFFQTNPGTAEVLYRDTLERLELREGVPFVDLYCGVGGLALPAAKITGWALGVEGVKGAIDSARESAKRQDIPAEFQSGQVEEVLPALARRLSEARPVISVNPARRGLEPGVVDGIMTIKPRRLAYISCNPRALARDLALFRDHGMKLESIALYDMFPNTPHVESVAILVADDADAPVRRAPRRKVVGKGDAR